MEQCPICGGAATLIREDRQIAIGHRKTLVPHEFMRCDDCGEEYFLPGQMDSVMRRASEKIRREEGLLTPSEIRTIREKYGLTQVEFERLLGIGPKTVVRWEKGTVFQNAATDALLRLLDRYPENARFLAERHGVDLRGARDQSVPVRS